MSLLSDEVDLNTTSARKADEVSESMDKTEAESSNSAPIQLEPTKDEMEQERLMSRLEQLQDDIARLGNELAEKEAELAEVKKQLGITPFTEFKQSMAQGWRVVGDKWKEVKETQTYQKTMTSLSEGGKKVSSGLSSAGTKIKENETLKSMGEKTSSAFKRTGSVIKDTGTAIKENETIKNMGTKISGAATSLKEKVWSSSGDHADGSVPNGNAPTKGETVVPDEPAKE